jgi:glycine/D-amino acid oxidase-like deaminating enzyme
LEEAYAWAGTFATTEDGLPYIGELATHPGVWMALGYGGNGITFAVIAARLIRDAFAGHANADANLFGLPRRPLTDIGIALAHSERRHGERTGLLP